jgi:hypothetical protein
LILRTQTEHDAGELVAVFDGKHGWFWRNRSGGQVAVPVIVATLGNYLGSCTTYWLARRAASALG